jgi:NitT/TauT family transport system permease protein
MSVSSDARNGPSEQQPEGTRTSRAVSEASTAFATLLSRLGPPAIAIAIFLLIWEAITRLEFVPAYVLPSPTAIAATLWNQAGYFWFQTERTLFETVVGGALGAALGILVGTGIAMSVPLRRALYPLVVASQSLPTLALAPILILWLGYGTEPKIVIVVQVVFFPVAVGTISGLLSVAPEVLLFGRTLGASNWDLFRKVRMPASLPYVFTGLKVGASYAPIAALIGEWMGSDRGLGTLMLRAQVTLNTTVLFGAVVIVTLAGVGAFLLTEFIERRVIPWHYHQSA